MAGRVLRYDGKWWYRTILGNWWQVSTLRQDQEISAGDRSRVNDNNLEGILEELHTNVLNGVLPAHIRPDLEFDVPITLVDIQRAVARRPT